MSPPSIEVLEGDGASAMRNSRMYRSNNGGMDPPSGGAAVGREEESKSKSRSSSGSKHHRKSKSRSSSKKKERSGVEEELAEVIRKAKLSKEKSKRKEKESSRDKAERKKSKKRSSKEKASRRSSTGDHKKSSKDKTKSSSSALSPKQKAKRRLSADMRKQIRNLEPLLVSSDDESSPEEDGIEQPKQRETIVVPSNENLGKNRTRFHSILDEILDEREEQAKRNNENDEDELQASSTHTYGRLYNSADFEGSSRRLSTGMPEANLEAQWEEEAEDESGWSDTDGASTDDDDDIFDNLSVGSEPSLLQKFQQQQQEASSALGTTPAEEDNEPRSPRRMSGLEAAFRNLQQQQLQTTSPTREYPVKSPALVEHNVDSNEKQPAPEEPINTSNPTLNIPELPPQPETITPTPPSTPPPPDIKKDATGRDDTERTEEDISESSNYSPLTVVKIVDPSLSESESRLSLVAEESESEEKTPEPPTLQEQTQMEQETEEIQAPSAHENVPPPSGAEDNGEQRLLILGGGVKSLVQEFNTRDETNKDVESPMFLTNIASRRFSAPSCTSIVQEASPPTTPLSSSRASIGFLPKNDDQQNTIQDLTAPSAISVDPECVDVTNNLGNEDMDYPQPEESAAILADSQGADVTNAPGNEHIEELRSEEQEQGENCEESEDADSCAAIGWGQSPASPLPPQMGIRTDDDDDDDDDEVEPWEFGSAPISLKEEAPREAALQSHLTDPINHHLPQEQGLADDATVNSTDPMVPWLFGSVKNELTDLRPGGSVPTMTTATPHERAQSLHVTSEPVEAPETDFDSWLFGSAPLDHDTRNVAAPARPEWLSKSMGDIPGTLEEDNNYVDQNDERNNVNSSMYGQGSIAVSGVPEVTTAVPQPPNSPKSKRRWLNLRRNRKQKQGPVIVPDVHDQQLSKAEKMQREERAASNRRRMARRRANAAAQVAANN